jgi:hypothetical protein
MLKRYFSRNKAAQLFCFLIWVAFTLQSSNEANARPPCSPECDHLNSELDLNENLKVQLLEVKSSNLAFYESLEANQQPQKKEAKANLKSVADRLRITAQQRTLINRKLKNLGCGHCPSEMHQLSTKQKRH